MIKIEVDNIGAIKKAHFDGVKDLILNRVNFYLLAFKVMDRQAGFTIASVLSFTGLSTRTKTSLLTIIGRNKRSISNQTHYSRLRNRTSLSKHFYNHRADYIALLTTLSNQNNLEALILSEVDDLQSTNQAYQQAWFTKETAKFIKAIIPYDEFIDKATTPYNAYDLSNALKVNVCVYCNRIYTNTVIGTGRDLVVRPILDHYFHQALHPFLGLSFYNLIPSCNYCNSNLKGDKLFTLNMHIHPYKEGFGNDATFDYLQVGLNPDKSDPRNYNVTLTENVSYPNMKHTQIFGVHGVDNSGNVKVFKIREVYQSHADVVGELIVKSDKLSPYYAGNIVDMLTRLGASTKEFYRFYFANYLDEKDFNKRPLAKLTKDIVSKYLPEIFK